MKASLRRGLFRVGSCRRAVHQVPVDGDGVPLMRANERLEAIGAELTEALAHEGVYVCDDFLGRDCAAAMRRDAERMREAGRFEASMSVDERNVAFAKEGVFSVELEPSDFDAAPHCLAYTRDVMLTLPGILNRRFDGAVSTTSYGTKLAVARPGSKYPIHLDNACARDAAMGYPVDRRFVTWIYYLNPGWDRDHGGELRFWRQDDGSSVDVAPVADRAVAFFADRLCHEVLPSTSDAPDRYALTLWLCAAGHDRLCAPDRPGRQTRLAHFPDDAYS